MRKVSIVKTALTFSLCLFAGVGFSFVAAYAFRPLPVAEAKIPVTNFDNIQGLRGGSIYSNDPFKFKAPAMEAPDIPGVPPVPNMPQGMPEQEKTRVLGVLPPDVCIISDAGKIFTCMVGEEIPLGVVSSISSKGVMIDGTFYRIK